MKYMNWYKNNDIIQIAESQGLNMLEMSVCAAQ